LPGCPEAPAAAMKNNARMARPEPIVHSSLLSFKIAFTASGTNRSGLFYCRTRHHSSVTGVCGAVDIQQVAPQRAKQVEAESVCSVGARALRRFMDLDENGVASGGHGGA